MAEIVERLWVEDHIGLIGEMGSLDSMTDDLAVPADFLEKVKASDDDPMFVTVEVESGMSRSKRNWKPEHVRSVVDKVNKDRMSGNLGHPLIDKDAYESAFPEPQVVWVAAKAREAGGKVVGKFKGYVLKTAKARDYLRLGLIDGVSWFGNTKMRPIAGGGYDVVSFEPETLDFARKGRSGMASRVLSLAGEMESKGGFTLEPREVAALTPAEIKEHAPLVYKAIQDEAKSDLETKVGEQATLVATLEPEAEISKKVRELLGLAEGENPIEKLTNILTTVEEAASRDVKDFIKSLIANKVKTERAQGVVGRLIGEMHSEYEGQELTDDLKKKIEQDFEDRIDGDEDVKALVGEMAGWTEPANERRSRGGTSLGGRTRGAESRGRQNIENDGVTHRGGLKITKRKLG